MDFSGWVRRPRGASLGLVPLRMMPVRGRSGRGQSPGEELAMPCAWIRVAVVALVVLSVGTLAVRPASAQEATPTANTGHPLVGAWILDRDVTQPTNPLQLIVA